MAKEEPKDKQDEPGEQDGGAVPPTTPVLRDARGRWLPGASANPHGVGLKGGHQRRRLLEAVRSQVSLEDLKAILAKAVEQAKAGDRHARTWVGEVCWGKDPQLHLALIELGDRQTTGGAERSAAEILAQLREAYAAHKAARAGSTRDAEFDATDRGGEGGG